MHILTYATSPEMPQNGGTINTFSQYLMTMLSFIVFLNFIAKFQHASMEFECSHGYEPPTRSVLSADASKNCINRRKS